MFSKAGCYCCVKMSIYGVKVKMLNTREDYRNGCWYLVGRSKPMRSHGKVIPVKSGISRVLAGHVPFVPGKRRNTGMC